MKIKIVEFITLTLLLSFSIIGYAELSIKIFSIERVENPFPTPGISAFVVFSGNYAYSLAAKNPKSGESVSLPRPIKSELVGYSYHFEWGDYMTTPNYPPDIGLVLDRNVSGDGNSFSFTDGFIILDAAGGWYTVYAGLSGQWKVYLIFPSGEKTIVVPQAKYANRTDLVEPYVPEAGKKHRK